jgi:acetyl-CoA acetyltransferase
MFAREREPLIVGAVRTPVGRGHPEKAGYGDVHPADPLGGAFVELLHRAEVHRDFGLVTMCCGGGVGTATLAQRI